MFVGTRCNRAAAVDVRNFCGRVVRYDLFQFYAGGIVKIGDPVRTEKHLSLFTSLTDRKHLQEVFKSLAFKPKCSPPFKGGVSALADGVVVRLFIYFCLNLIYEKTNPQPKGDGDLQKIAPQQRHPSRGFFVEFPKRIPT